MKKIAVAVLVGFVAVAAYAQGGGIGGDARFMAGVWDAYPARYSDAAGKASKKMEKEVAQAKAAKAAEDAKFDFADLPEDVPGKVKEEMKNTIKQKHPNFEHAAYIGQIDFFEDSHYNFANGTEIYTWTYYFVVTEGDKDYFYVGTRKQFPQGVFNKKKDILFDTDYMGETPRAEGLNYKQALKDFQATLPAPFKEHGKALLREIPFTLIDSLKVTDRGSFENIASGQRTITREYTVEYNLKDGSSLKQFFKYKPAREKYEGTYGYKYSGEVQKI